MTSFSQLSPRKNRVSAKGRVSITRFEISASRMSPSTKNTPDPYIFGDSDDKDEAVKETEGFSRQNEEARKKYDDQISQAYGHVISCIRQNFRHIAHYHTAGVPGRHDLDEDQELYYPAIVCAIQETGCDGWLAHEFTRKGDPVAALEAAFRRCDI